MSIHKTAEWFALAIPAPTIKNFNVQNGVHAEEFAEHLAALKGADENSEKLLREFQAHCETFATSLKTLEVKVEVADKQELLDALADQLVTATGVAHMCGFNLSGALEHVNLSNFSKFDENGKPIFDANGKIAKNMSTYFKPDLTKYLQK